MAKNLTDGLARLQIESRIPATTWRQWCTMLKMDPVDAIEVWEEICHPIMVANRKVPDIPYILQLRSARPELDIFEFKEETGKVLHFVTFLYGLRDERLTKGKVRSALLKLYREVASKASPTQPSYLFVQRFLIEACTLVLVAKVFKGPSITLSGVMKPVLEGRGSIEQIVGLGLKSLGDELYADSVRECLDARFLDPDAAPRPVSANGDDGDVADDADDADDDDDDDDEENDEDDDDDDDDDDEEDEDDEDDLIDDFLLKFKTALHDIYEFQAGGIGEEGIDGEGEAPEEEQVLESRLKVTAGFNPLRAGIPSMEEAQNIARRAEAARNPTRTHKPTFTARPTAPAGGGGGGGSGGGSRASATAAGGGDGAPVTAGGSAPRPAPRKDGKGEVRVDMDKVERVDVEPTDLVDAADVTFDDFGDKTNQVCVALAGVEKADQTVWSVFLDPGASIGDLAGFSRTLSKENTDTYKAYAAVKIAAQYLGLKNLLSVSDRVLQKDRNFSVEVTSLLNYVNNSNKPVLPDSRQVSSLGKVLDHAGAALVRLEGLRTNYNFSHDHKEEYSRETVTVYFEEAIRPITDLTDRDILNLAREKADSDSVALLAQFEADQFVEQVEQTVREYVGRLVDEGHVKSEAAFKAEIDETPLVFEGAEKGADDQVPAKLMKASDTGDIFAEVCKYVCTEVWMVIDEVHKPENTIPEIIEMIRQLLVGNMSFQSEKRRHQDRPAIALSVVSLDKVSGNANLKDLYVRVGESGQIHYVEDYEDGSYVDLFEMREYKPSRVATAAKRKAEEEDTEMLQTGRKYLYTIGRTNRLFGDMPADVINGCVRGESGGPKLFPAF